jgi:uncharacterized membrane protein YphA (DoxX/SURF4 family)
MSYNINMNTNIKNTILLIIRIAVGGMIAYAGIMKLMDMDTTVAKMSGMGLSAGVVWAVALGELLAGLGVLFGVYTQVAAVGTAIIMAGAVYYTKGTMMPPIYLLLGSLVLIFMGSGKFAIKPCVCSCEGGTCTPKAPEVK